MSLKIVLKTIQTKEANVNHKDALIKTLLLVPKVANNIERISFLVECRKAHVFPKFIQGLLTKTSVISSRNSSFEDKKRRFAKDMLNEAIKESFRKQAYLLREKRRLEEDASETGSSLWHWLQEQCSMLFKTYRDENRRRLLNKLERLKNEQNSTDQSRPEEHSSPRQEHANSEAHPAAVVDGRVAGGSTTATSFKNFSHLQLTSNVSELLNRGPKFALTRKVSTTVLKEVESGMERGAYAIRWKTHLENKRTTQVPQQQQQQRQQEQQQPRQQHQHQQPQPQSQPPPLPQPQSQPPPLPQPQSQPQPQPPLQPQQQPRPQTSQGQPPPPTQQQQHKDLKPRFPDGDCGQAPVGSGELETSIKQVKKKVLAAYKNHSKHLPNHSRAQVDALNQLARDNSVVVKPSDKGKGLVLMDAAEYAHKIDSITADYEPVPRNPIPRLEATTRRVIHGTMDGKVDERVVKAIVPHCSRTAELYGLPKDHKDGVPLRPIVSACDDPLDKLNWLLERVVTQLLPFVPAHLKNTSQFLDKLSEQYPAGFGQATILFSVDVINLYGNIPINEAIDATMCLLTHHKERVETFGLDSDSIRRLLEHGLTNNFVRFGQSYFRQAEGIAMGSRVAPPLAIVFMHALETLFLAAPRLQPSLYVRYVDDVFGVWQHGKESLLEYFTFLNTIHPKVKFTIEHTSDTGELAFLDSKISISESGAYTTELYVKPTASPVIIHFKSALPMSTKKNTLRSQFLRAIKVSSPGLPRARSLKKIEDLFLKNDYPLHLVKKVRGEALRGRPERKRDNVHNNAPIFLVLPFVDDDLCRKTEGIIRASGLNVRVAWKGGPNLRQKLVRSAFLQVSPVLVGGGSANAARQDSREGVIPKMWCTAWTAGCARATSHFM